MVALVALTLLAGADAVTVRTKPRVFAGQGQPTVTVIVQAPILGATLVLRRADGRTFRFSVPASHQGEYPFALEQSAGPALAYQGDLAVEFPGGESGSIPLSFNGEVVTPIRVDTWASAADIKQREFHFRMNRPVAKVDLQLIGEGNTALADQTLIFADAQAGQELRGRWRETHVPVVVIDATFHDRSGLFQKLRLYPWYVEVPHEEVHFPTAAFEVPAAEEPKLEAALVGVLAAAAKAREFAPIKLYVLGHTDSVGARADNAKLSRQRARAMAACFRRHGFDLPIVYAGLGEDQLVVPTPDETANAKNRRAQYIVAVEPPTTPPVEWTSF